MPSSSLVEVEVEAEVGVEVEVGVWGLWFGLRLGLNHLVKIFTSTGEWEEKPRLKLRKGFKIKKM